MADSENTIVPTGPVTSGDIIDLNFSLFRAQSLCRITYDSLGIGSEEELDARNALALIEEQIGVAIEAINVLESRAIAYRKTQEVSHGD